MRVLYSVSCKDALNPFLETLTDAIKQEDPSVVFCFDSDSIWNDKVYGFDILHIMWPEFLVDEHHSANDLKHRLEEIKSKGVHIVSTCHNLEPHYCSIQNKRDAVEFAYGASDVIHHLGQYSIDCLSALYPDVRHELIPHHIYDNLYKNIPSKTEACKHLGLSSCYDYILCLGAIRSCEEIGLLDYVARNLKRGVKIVAPSLILNIGGRYDLKTRFHYYRHKYITYHNRLISNLGIISNQDLPYYLAISDITLIQRLKILNSGNLTLGMHAGNVVIGPEIGNVGAILKETGNYTFRRPDEIPHLINLARCAAKSGKGQSNRAYALSNWSSSFVATKVLNSYHTLLT